MTKRILVIVTLAALAGALAVFMLIFSREDKPAAAANFPSPEEPVYVPSAGENREISRISVENENGGYTISDAPEEGFFIEGFEDLPVNTNTLSFTVNRLSRLRSREVVEPAADPAPFGLADPAARVTLSFTDGTTGVLYVGSLAPDGINHYVKSGDSPAIHLVSSTDLGDCFSRALDFVDKAITPPNESPEAPVFDTITLGGLVRGKEPVSIVYRPVPEDDSAASGFLRNPYRIIRPLEAGVSLDRGPPILQALFGLQADRVAARLGGGLSPADFGLAEPYSTVTVSGTPGGGLGGFSLRASAPNPEGLVYIQPEGSSLVYEVDESKLSWLGVTFFDLMDRMVRLPFIDSVASIELRGEKPLASFTLSGEGDDLVVKAGDAVIDTANFRPFYQTLIAAIYDEYCDIPAPEEGVPPLLEIVYRYRDGRASDTVSFYPASSRRVLTSLNKGRPFYTYRAYTDKVMADLERLLAGEKVLSYL
ncbi:MAG: DUF4340 domain-containing protein [Spirochaetaceae bacterium]|nr:DUF4340 domain-containing protein [Spirochaetaceae bacterium]